MISSCLLISQKDDYTTSGTSSFVVYWDIIINGLYGGAPEEKQLDKVHNVS